ncbi:MAG TPA: hypothetical protein VF007_13345 [Stellaceae bacterium]
MNSRGGQLFPALVLGVAGLLSACQPLPHPFADDRPPADLLTVRDSIGVAIGPIDGGPPDSVDKLGPALAGALLKRDIPASDRTTSLGSYQLYGQVGIANPKGGKPAVVAAWHLYDAQGKLIGEPTVRLDAVPKEWDSADEKLVAKLATASAEAVAPLLQDQTPSAEKAAAEDGKTRLAIAGVKGAPGDGGESLPKAVAAVLKNQDVHVVADSKKADLTLDGEVSVAPPNSGKQHVKIVWRLRRADGAEIGTVGQENDVPKGMLDGAWGDVAYSVAIAAGDGLMALVARGAPEHKS